MTALSIALVGAACAVVVAGFLLLCEHVRR
jgi:hypothetical protein